MTVNGRTEEVKSAIYVELPVEDLGEKGVALYLLNEVITGVPQGQPEFAVTVVITESLYGKTIDLTQPVARSSYLNIVAININDELDVEYDVGTVDTFTEATVTGGTLLMTRSGDDFNVKLSITLSDGNSASADWKGKATKVEIPY